MAQVTKQQWLDTIQNGLMAELAAHAKALPKGFQQERFVLNAIQVISDNAKDFNNIAPESIKLALAKGAYLGLDFLRGECYAIPYAGICNFQTDYKGEIKLAKKYSRNKIKDIYAKNVREGDEFTEGISNGQQYVSFEPVPFSDAPIIGTVAVVLYEDGSMIYDTMSVKEIIHTKDVYSKAKNSKAWKESPGEMYKKTVLRRLLKLVDLEFDAIEQIRAFSEGSGFEFGDAPEPSGVIEEKPVNAFQNSAKKPEPAQIEKQPERKTVESVTAEIMEPERIPDEEFARFEQQFADFDAHASEYAIFDEV